VRRTLLAVPSLPPPPNVEQAQLLGGLWVDSLANSWAFARRARWPLATLSIGDEALVFSCSSMPRWTTQVVARSDCGQVVPVQWPRTWGWRGWTVERLDGGIPTLLFRRRRGVDRALRAAGWPVAPTVMPFGEFRTRSEARLVTVD